MLLDLLMLVSDRWNDQGKFPFHGFSASTDFLKMSKWWKPGPFPYPWPVDKNYEAILPSCLLHESSEWILFLSSVVTFHTSKVHLAHKSLHIRFPPRLFSPIQQNWFSVDQINQVYLHVRRLGVHQKLKNHCKNRFWKDLYVGWIPRS